MRSKIIVVMLLFAAAGVFAQQAVIQDITGTVELKRPGSATWEYAVRGQSIPVNTVISTGFKSYAVIGVGSSVLTVRPVTRLSITELTRAQETERIEVSLSSGRLRSDVKAPAGAKTSFTVQNPVATASVRGTIFEMDGFNVWVLNGTVSYAGVFGAPAIIDAGGSNSVNERTKRVVFPEDAESFILKPDLPIAWDYIPSVDRPVSSKSQTDMDSTAVINY